MSRRSLLPILIFTTACASQPPRTELERIERGMGKDQVLEISGNPKRTYHAQGQDHWVYVFFEGDRELVQQIDFRDGVVSRVSAPAPRASLKSRLEGADTMEDFERTVKEQRSKDSGFRDAPDDGKF